MTIVSNSKLYIFMTTSISQLGGAERYMAGKSNWLIENGWKVAIVGPCSGDLACNYGDALIFDFRYYGCKPEVLFRRTRIRCISSLLAYSSSFDEVHIESASLQMAYWGEYIASRLKCFHHIFYLHEQVPELNSSEHKFFQEKLDQGELYFISKGFCDALQLNSGDWSPVLRAGAPKAIQDVPYTGDTAHLIPRHYRVGCISRLDKVFLKDVISALSKIVMRHPGFKVELLLVGNAEDPHSRDKLDALASDGVELIFTGGLSPIPLSLVRTFDVAVGKSGGASCVAGEGILTISVALDTDRCMGVLGFDISKNVCEADADAKDMVETFEEVIFGTRYDTRPYPLEIAGPDEPNYSEHFERFGKGSSKPIYTYSVTSSSLRQWVKGSVYSVFGCRFGEHLLDFLGRRG